MGERAGGGSGQEGSGTIFLTGATGVVGSALGQALVAAGNPVIALTRRAPKATPVGIRFVEGDVTESGEWQRAVSGAAGVIHLAGEPIAAQRWSPQVKRTLRESRLVGTARLVEAIEQAASRPQALVCASATGYYGDRGEEVLDEDALPGDDFLARLCVDWEAAAKTARDHGVRVVSLRFGMVLSRRGGGLPRMLAPFRLGVGGPIGSPKNFVPWIHERDAAGLAHFAVSSAASGLSGALNAVGPEAVRMADFAATLGRALGRPSLLPVPTFAVRALLGESAAAVLSSQRVSAARVEASGYRFAFPTLREALTDLLRG